MSTKSDTVDERDTRPDSDNQPYPSWADMISRLRRDRGLETGTQADVEQPRDWHDLVADMIIGR